jgi:hypothetical protein
LTEESEERERMKPMKIIALFLPLFTASAAQAQSDLTISELLDQGYKIVAASSKDDSNSPYVFLQKRRSAFMCITAPINSSCFNLNNQ